jgi:hypothetical protein
VSRHGFQLFDEFGARPRPPCWLRVEQTTNELYNLRRESRMQNVDIKYFDSGKAGKIISGISRERDRQVSGQRKE